MNVALMLERRANDKAIAYRNLVSEIYSNKSCENIVAKKVAGRYQIAPIRLPISIEPKVL